VAKGLAKEDNGMLIIMLPHFDIPLIVRKSDGGYGYDSTDMTALDYRLRILKRDWCIYITDAGQSNHFHMCFDAGKEAGWVNNNQRLDHIGFGVVQGDDGKRFKTRSSETVRLIDLLDAAKDRMEESLTVRVSEGKSPLSKDEIKSAAKIIGYGAVKYFDLKQHSSTNYIFSYDRMLDTKGDTAVYLLYSYARVVSILRKAKDDRGIIINDLIIDSLNLITLNHPSERALAFELLQFGDMIKVVLNELLPNRLCDYLKELSVKFSDFVTKCHVLNADETKSRLILCEATRSVMKKCFDLIGIETLDRI
jgi:arginyl-tRNA synthetase